MIIKIKKFFKNHVIDLTLLVGSIILTCFLHWIGVFDFLELKTYDYRFHKVRGPLTGWRASDSTIIRKGTDVVLVEVDDGNARYLVVMSIEPALYPGLLTSETTARLLSDAELEKVESLFSQVLSEWAEADEEDGQA